MTRSLQSVALALVVASVARADNPTPPAPLDAQLGKLHFPVSCKIYGFLDQTFDTVFTATAPVYGGTGEEIYYTDVTGNIDIPSSITGLAPFVGGAQASAQVTVDLKLTNASPSTFLAYNDTIRNITFSGGQDAHVRIPPGNGTLPPIGPVTLGDPNVAHRIFLGDVSVSVELQNSNGDPAFGPIPVTCGQQNIDFVIGSVNVNSTTGLAPLSPSVGYVPTFQDTPALTESGYFRFPYNCVFGPLGNESLDIIIGGNIATYFAPGEQFYLDSPDAFLTVPSALVTLAKEAYPNTFTFVTTINEFEILFTNASPETYNAAKSTITSTVLVPSDTSVPFVIPIPNNGYLPAVGPITAGANGTIVGVAVGKANATTALKDFFGNTLFSFPVTCDVPSPLELIGVPITTLQPGNYSLPI